MSLKVKKGGHKHDLISLLVINTQVLYVDAVCDGNNKTKTVLRKNFSVCAFYTCLFMQPLNEMEEEGHFGLCCCLSLNKNLKHLIKTLLRQKVF